MICGVIDIGSNSMRLAVYEVSKEKFRILWKEKVMAGLAGYIDGNRLSEEGIARACCGLFRFRELLDLLQVEQVSVFATASLRNISNTAEAVEQIKEKTGFAVEVISGEEEAEFGFRGALCEFDLQAGVFADIGGASTEVAHFRAGRLTDGQSFSVGSLKLYKDCVRKILPGLGSLERITKQIQTAMGPGDLAENVYGETLVCVGGTARAALKLIRKQFQLPSGSRGITTEQLEALCTMLCRGDKAAVQLILQHVPERIHTIVPGVLILRSLARQQKVANVVVSRYGVREGYLCQRIQAKLN